MQAQTGIQPRRYLGAWSRAQRQPNSKTRRLGAYLKRLETRMLRGLKNQEPPRSARMVPENGPCGSAAALC